MLIFMAKSKRGCAKTEVWGSVGREAHTQISTLEWRNLSNLSQTGYINAKLCLSNSSVLYMPKDARFYAFGKSLSIAQLKQPGRVL